MKDFTLVDIKNESSFDYIDTIKSNDETVLGYRVIKSVGYYSKRYNKFVVAEKGDRMDGATFAKDVPSFGWLFHDVLKHEKLFQDGTECTNWQASNILSDIMKAEGYWFRARSWFVSTWLWGCIVK